MDIKKEKMIEPIEFTKKNCEQALKDFTFEVFRRVDNCNYQNGHWVLKSRKQRQHDLLQKLINEYFDRDK